MLRKRSTINAPLLVALFLALPTSGQAIPGSAVAHTRSGVSVDFCIRIPDVLRIEPTGSTMRNGVIRTVHIENGVRLVTVSKP
jgi:hypothetical protein